VVQGDELLLGPDRHGHWTRVQVRSVHAERLAVRQASAGQRAAFALRRVKRSAVRRGMVLLALPRAGEETPKATLTFQADVVVLSHHAQLAVGMEPVVQTIALRQCARLVTIADRAPDKPLTTGERGRVTFAFKFLPEWVRQGQRIVFTQGACKGLGVIVSVEGDAPTHLPQQQLLLSASSTLAPPPASSSGSTTPLNASLMATAKAFS